MLEVEVKAKIQDKEALLTRLQEKGIIFDALHTQKDRIFVQDASSVVAFYSNKIFIRIREQAEQKPKLTVKKKQASLASIEYEAFIESAGVFGPILEALGYLEALTVNKTRQKQKYQEYTICIDALEGLGDFIEIEKLVSEGDIEKIQKELFEFLKDFGITKNDRVTDAYDTMILKKQLNGSL